MEGRHVGLDFYDLLIEVIELASACRGVIVVMVVLGKREGGNGKKHAKEGG